MAATTARKSATKAKKSAKKTPAAKAGKTDKAGRTGKTGKAAVRKTPARKVAGKTVGRTATKKAAQKPAAPATKTTAAPPSKAGKTVGKKAVGKKTASKKTTSKTANSRTAPATAATTKKTTPVHKQAASPARKPHKITPARALANTRALLEAKQAHDRQPQPWQTLDPEQAHLPQDGFQSPEAAARAEELHAGESRMPAIQGSISTHDRHNQGKRDGR